MELHTVRKNTHCTKLHRVPFAFNVEKILSLEKNFTHAVTARLTNISYEHTLSHTLLIEQSVTQSFSGLRKGVLCTAGSELAIDPPALRS